MTAPRREDYGIAQLEALADGCVLVTTPAPGPYAALPLARELDSAARRAATLHAAIRAALDDPAPRYAERALPRSRPSPRRPSTGSSHSICCRACSRRRLDGTARL